MYAFQSSVHLRSARRHFDENRERIGAKSHHRSVGRNSVNIATVVNTAVLAVQPLKLLERAREHRHALALLESQEMARRALTDALAEAQQALEFKDVVIREVHHRVKNTIQMAASLLALHARATPSEEVRCSLQASYGRLRLLAKVHELLYASSASTQEVPLPPLFQALGDALQQSFAEMSDRVELRITSDPVELSADEAIPLALLANELITNAYKHAFPQDSMGEIVLNLSWTAEPALVLHVRDNGVGMRPNGVEIGLGLQLIRAFAAQLHGTLAFGEPVDAAGTTVTLTLPRGAKPTQALELRS
jgi:two-component sensor histidine kinase